MEATMEERINKAVEEAVAKAVAPLLETIEEKDKEILRLKSQIKKLSVYCKKTWAKSFRYINWSLF